MTKMQKVLKQLSYLTTYKVDKKDLKRFIVYFHSPKRICVREFDTLRPEAWFMDGKPRLIETGFDTVKGLTDFLVANGVILIKKPKPLPKSYSIYD